MRRVIVSLSTFSRLGFALLPLIALAGCYPTSPQPVSLKLERLDTYREFDFGPWDRIRSVDVCLDTTGTLVGTLCASLDVPAGHELNLWFWRAPESESDSLRIVPLLKGVSEAKLRSQRGALFVVYPSANELCELTSRDGGANWTCRVLLSLDELHRFGSFEVLATDDSTCLVAYTVVRRMGDRESPSDSTLGLYVSEISSDTLRSTDCLIRIPTMYWSTTPHLVLSAQGPVVSMAYQRRRPDPSPGQSTSIHGLVLARLLPEESGWSVVAHPTTESGRSSFGFPEKTLVIPIGPNLGVLSFGQGSCLMTVTPDGQQQCGELPWVEAAWSQSTDGASTLRRNSDEVIAWAREGHQGGILRDLAYGGPKDNEVFVQSMRAENFGAPVLGRPLALTKSGTISDFIHLMAAEDRAFVVWSWTASTRSGDEADPPTLCIATLRFQ